MPETPWHPDTIGLIKLGFLTWLGGAVGLLCRYRAATPDWCGLIQLGFLTWLGGAAGLLCRYRAATPETWGQACDVPVAR